MGETNYSSVAHVCYDISLLSRVKFKMLTTCLKFYENLEIFETFLRLKKKFENFEIL